MQLRKQSVGGCQSVTMHNMRAQASCCCCCLLFVEVVAAATRQVSHLVAILVL